MYGLFIFSVAFCLTALAMFAGVGVCFRVYRKKQKIQKQSIRNAERHRAQQLKNEMLEAELENRKNELVKQTSMLARREKLIGTLLEELERQKNMLGDRYPTQLYKRMRSLMEQALNGNNERLILEAYFNSAHQNFVERFRRQYAGITTGDLRICCLLRMNLSTKEIASILNISVRAVELRRYRLRKRIGLDNDTNLIDFLLNF
jgi:DNA-binding CsgD family transcriptional regulator